MQIDKAIEVARELSNLLFDVAVKDMRTGRPERAEKAFQRAEAIKTVCNEVETLRETCRGYAEALARQDSGQIQAESDESGDVVEMLGWK